MGVLANKENKRLFIELAAWLILFTFVSQVFLFVDLHRFLWEILLLTVLLGACILYACYQYFKRQDALMEKAVSQINAVITGNTQERIACEEEGELYRLFHSVNTLAAICNAQLENESKEKEDLKNTILDISHQLKTPLAALNIYNGILKEEVDKNGQLQQFLAMSEQELDRIETLVQNLLKLAKLDVGTIQLEMRRENVAEMLRDIELHFKYRADKEKKELRTEGPENIFLCCDRDWLMEAIENLVKNALDHTKEGDFVSISWRQLTVNMIQIVVKDNGCGIHPEDIYHIFKRFYRSRFSKDQQGIGLGLPLAKAIIEAHHGTIEVDSELGAGSTFELQFLLNS